jgi:hypothetical protein
MKKPSKEITGGGVAFVIVYAVDPILKCQGDIHAIGRDKTNGKRLKSYFVIGDDTRKKCGDYVSQGIKSVSRVALQGEIISTPFLV